MGESFTELSFLLQTHKSGPTVCVFDLLHDSIFVYYRCSIMLHMIDVEAYSDIHSRIQSLGLLLSRVIGILVFHLRHCKKTTC